MYRTFRFYTDYALGGVRGGNRKEPAYSIWRKIAYAEQTDTPLTSSLLPEWTKTNTFLNTQNLNFSARISRLCSNNVLANRRAVRKQKVS